MADPTIGVNVIMEYNANGDEVTPSWVRIGFQAGGDLSVDTTIADITTKDHNGWSASLPTLNSWTFSLEGKMQRGDAGVLYLERCSIDKTVASVRWRVLNSPTKAWRGRAAIENFKYSFPTDEAVTWTCSLRGLGELIEESPIALV